MWWGIDASLTPTPTHPFNTQTNPIPQGDLIQSRTQLATATQHPLPWKAGCPSVMAWSIRVGSVQYQPSSESTFAQLLAASPSLKSNLLQ